MNNTKDIKDILYELKKAITNVYKDRLRKLLLFGSWARGENTKDSDIDIAIVLEGDVLPGKEIDRITDVVYEINLKYNVLISIYPVSEYNYLNTNSPLLINIRKQGIVL